MLSRQQVFDELIDILAERVANYVHLPPAAPIGPPVAPIAPPTLPVVPPALPVAPPVLPAAPAVPPVTAPVIDPNTANGAQPVVATGNNANQHNLVHGNVNLSAMLTLQQIDLLLAAFSKFLDSPVTKALIDATTKSLDFQQTVRQVMTDLRNDHIQQLKEFHSEMKADTKLEHAKTESKLKDLIENKRILEEISNATLQHRNEIEESLATMENMLKLNFGLIFQQLGSTTNSVTDDVNRRDITRAFRQCMNNATEYKGGWNNATYFNCNKLGPGDFLSRLSDLLDRDPDNVILLRCCTYHQNQISLKASIRIGGQAKVTGDDVAFLTVHRNVDTVSYPLKKLVLSNLVDTGYRNLILIQLLHDTFGGIMGPIGSDLEHDKLFKNLTDDIVLLLRDGILIYYGIDHTDFEIHGIEFVELSLDANFELSVRIKVSSNTLPKGYKIKSFKNALERFSQARLLKAIVPAMDYADPLDTFVKHFLMSVLS